MPEAGKECLEPGGKLMGLTCPNFSQGLDRLGWKIRNKWKVGGDARKGVT